DRRPHLLEIGLAAGAVRDVPLETIVQLRRERNLEIVGDELEQILTGKLLVGVVRLRHVMSARGTAPAPPEPTSEPGGAILVGWSRSASERYTRLRHSSPRCRVGR